MLAVVVLCWARINNTADSASTSTEAARVTFDTNGVDADVTADGAVVESRLEDNGEEDAERFVCRPHITIQAPAAVSRSDAARRSDCNCSGDSAPVTEGEKEAATLARQLRELVETCRGGGGGTGGGGVRGGGGTGDWSRQLYEALLDLTTVLKQFQTPGIPVPGNNPW